MIKDINDYVPIIKKEYPHLDERQITDILKYGWKMYYWLNTHGCDVINLDTMKHKIVSFTGYLYRDLLKAYEHARRKWRLKERTLYFFKKKKWDGYYYFGATKSQHDEIQARMKDKNKHMVYINKKVYTKCKEELYHNLAFVAIYRVKFPFDYGMAFFKKSYVVRKENVEYIKLNSLSKWHKKQMQMSLQTE